MNKLLTIVMVVILTAGTTFATINYKDSKQSTIHVKRADSYSSWESITEESQEVVLAKVLNHSTQIKNDFLTFQIAQVKVQQSIKGSLSSNKVINLLQTKCAEDPIVSKSDQVLLFLEKYEGPVTDQDAVYVCKGLFDGQYKIINNKVYPSYQEDTANNSGTVNGKKNSIWGTPNDLNTIVSLLESY